MIGDIGGSGINRAKSWGSLPGTGRSTKNAPVDRIALRAGILDFVMAT